MMHILITGKNSYVGTSLEKWLMEESDKYRVDTIDMQIESWKNSSFAKYDVVFHVAGIAHSDMKKVSEEQKKEYYKVNTDFRPCTSNCIKGQNALYSNAFGISRLQISEKLNTSF